MYILPPSISKKIEGYRWQRFTPPAAGKSRRFRGLICHRRSHRRSRELGFTLDQVRGLLGFIDSRDYTCADVKTMTDEHLTELRRKIADLRKMERVLKDMAAQCSGGGVPECPVIDALSEQV